MKKILILYGSYGGGHLSAAKTLQAYFNENYQDVEVEIIDCIEYINKHLNKVSTEAYKEFAKKMPWVWKRVYNKSKSGALAFLSTTNNKILSLKLKKLLEEENPDLVISTHPFATTMCAYLKEKEKVNFKMATILTDYHIHPQWLVLNQYNDVFFVANEQMKMDMISYNIDDEKIFVSGIPISERFLEPKNKTEGYQGQMEENERKQIESIMNKKKEEREKNQGTRRGAPRGRGRVRRGGFRGRGRGRGFGGRPRRGGRGTSRASPRGRGTTRGSGNRGQRGSTAPRGNKGRGSSS
jgi:hypothetical protein